jgi:hypothetical protein
MHSRRPLTAPVLHALLLPALLLTVPASAATAPQQDCRDAPTCRQLALDAKQRNDFEAFHDLAWKAMNVGPKNDPASMTLLARAQSLSGRPLDALVMLQRLAAMGVITDAPTSDDFERVRALPAWADASAKLSGTPAPETALPATPASPAPSKPAAGAKPKPAPVEPAAAAKTAKPNARPETPAVAEKPKAEEPVAVPVPPPTADKTALPDAPPAAKNPKAAKAEAGAKREPAALRFPGAGVHPVGLAYDAVSGRFILGDRADRRLLVLGERSGRLASLAGADAGFNDLAALEVDAKEGDLWVVSASNATRSSTVHKLQLISGRVLASIAAPDGDLPARFTDVAITPQSVLVLDGEGRRIFRAAKKGKTLEVAARLGVPAASSLAPAAEGVVYVAYDEGILRVDLAARAMSVVEPAPKGGVAGISWMRWFRGSLIAIQVSSVQQARLVRFRLDEAGRAVRAVEVLDENVGPAAANSAANSAAISESVLYYLNRAADAGDVIVRKLPLK